MQFNTLTSIACVSIATNRFFLTMAMTGKEIKRTLCRCEKCVYMVRVFFYYLVCEAIGTAATPGLLCQPPVIIKMIVEKQMECRLAGETEVLRENLPQRHFCPSQNLT
jgi:hypothetical protein